VGPDVNVTVDESTNTATLVLPTDPIGGDGAVSLRDTQSLRGINASKHAVNELNITLPGDKSDWNSFGSATVKISGFNGTYSVTFDNNKETNGPCLDDVQVDVQVVFTPKVGDKQTWYRGDAFSDSGGAFTYECTGESYELYADLTGASTLGYRIGSNPSGRTPVTFGEHPADRDGDGDPTTYAAGESTSIDELTNHYVALTGANTELAITSRSGNGKKKKKDNGKSGLDTDAATGAIDYDSGTVITYLRVTNATVNTTFN